MGFLILFSACCAQKSQTQYSTGEHALWLGTLWGHNVSHFAFGLLGNKYNLIFFLFSVC